jgi:hypothetical protein
MDQPEDGDLPDDFKIGVAVVECDVEIRMGFVRKVRILGRTYLSASQLMDDEPLLATHLFYHFSPPGVQHPLRPAPPHCHYLSRASTPFRR